MSSMTNLDILSDDFLEITLTNEFDIFSPKKMVLSFDKLIKKLNQLEIFSVNFDQPTEIVGRETNEPLVYIYNTHSDENYKQIGTQSFTNDVNYASYLLRDHLQSYGIISIVEGTRITDLLEKRNLKYNQSYLLSREFLQANKKKYPSIKIFIDLHRDSQPGEITTASVDGKSYARIMFVVGTEHLNYIENINFASKVVNIVDSLKNGVTRNIYLKDHTMGNGIYNQDLGKYVCLIELGGYENDIDEVENSIKLLAEAIYLIIKGDNIGGT